MYSGYMMRCSYDVRAGSGGCPNERTLDYEFCVEHLNTPRGRQHVMAVIESGYITVPSQVEQAIKEASEIPDVDYQTTALEKMATALDTIQGWVDESRANLDGLGGPSAWRFTDRAGQEQQHTFLGVYERALGQLSRHLSSMSKVALQEKIVSLGKAQVDMMIRMMMSVITELALDNAKTDLARQILLTKLTEEANLVPRVEKHAEERLAISSAQTVSMANDYQSSQTSRMTGGVTGVSMRGENIA